MADGISLKALVDKRKNKVIFGEATGDFLDVLCSFLTMPMGTIVKQTQGQPPAIDIGCMNNLYQSVDNLNVRFLASEACKTMLLHPRSAAESYCRKLKLTIDDVQPTRYFLCRNRDCTAPMLHHYMEAQCSCGQYLAETYLHGKPEPYSSATLDGGVFVKRLTQLLVSDDLQLNPPSTTSSLSLLAKLGIMDTSTIEEKTFNLGVNEILILLKCSLVSKTPLTEALLKNDLVPSESKEDLDGGYIRSYIETGAMSGDGKIRVKIIVSKSKKLVCYAEAGKDFVDLLFSFLILPLGFILEEMIGSSFRGCVDSLYNSVKELDSESYMESDEQKTMLLCPKVAPGFCYENQPLSIKEASYPLYYRRIDWDNVIRRTSDEILLSSDFKMGTLTVMDPKIKSCYKGAETGGGFVGEAAMFTVTDNLVVMPISPVSGISILNKLKVPFSDVEERIVYVGNEEAARLLVASFVSESALTNTFTRRELKQEKARNY